MLYQGVVEKGSKRATELGFPTLNISLVDGEIPGIYAARVTIGENTYIAAAFIGKRPILEVHIIDVQLPELYGKTVLIELQKKIREGSDFANDKDLRAAIEKDITAVKKYFDTYV